MSDEGEGKKGVLKARPGKLELKKTVDAGQVRQSFSHGRTKSVAVEVRRKRTFTQGAGGSMEEVKRKAAAKEADEAETAKKVETETPETPEDEEAKSPTVLRTLTEQEAAARARALEGARADDGGANKILEQTTETAEARRAAAKAEEDARKVEEEKRQEEEQLRREEEEKRKLEEEEAAKRAAEQAAKLEERMANREAALDTTKIEAEEKEESRNKRAARPERRPSARRTEPRRRAGKLTVAQALNDDERVRSLASVRRARERERRNTRVQPQEAVKIVRDVVVPETITVQELANRMTERGVDVIKSLMKLGVMATLQQTIDADTAELIVAEFGHNLQRVSEADVEIGLKGEEDAEETLKSRAPVVTVMGHVDHGKTSLLDALRSTDVAAGEAGGITQHIGAYQVEIASGDRITFIDTPGHAAFTSMRARGANVTDIVILVVAADDGIMPQTIEAIDHAKAAEVPIIVAINKIDRPNADATRVRNELLQHELVVEEMGGDILAIEVSATEKTNLDKLEEAILLQAELLELKANPDRPAEGVVVEANLETGRGAVATMLIQRGTLSAGDIVVAGAEWGRVRAISGHDGNSIEGAGPAQPVEIMGLSGAPLAGDEFAVVENEQRAREITEFRSRRDRAQKSAAAPRGTLEQMFLEIEAGQLQELPIVVKADTHGSVEAIIGSLEKIGTEEVTARVLHSGVGGINESDVSLAQASNAFIVGFNVRANSQARDFARKESVDIQYYSVIYNLLDDIRDMMSGLLTPESKETFLGNAEILEVFNISKVGKIAGCKVTEGMVKRGAAVRLLRDNVVIHEGSLGTLKRFKDEVREVRDGMECGMAFENYQDIKTGDIIECFDVEEVARSL
ncbi:MAG: translation initiation factor IF-2 [Rhodospirillaceae bacterium]|mgnify:CR=1 FL=1|nr:translation initiation factor IF-2 [Rhodospirillaceae bacterium]|tara:strand:+ start:5628 stop:8216 length:2589 start_codon:yes stop_codon:yes gene_type:complete